MPFPETVEERYAAQPSFRALVDTLENYISWLGFAPADVHDAAVLACLRYESRTLRPRVIYINAAGEASLSL